MNALNGAKEAMTWIDGTDTDKYFLAKAQAYAAIAQAEAQVRQVAAMETNNELYAEFLEREKTRDKERKSENGFLARLHRIVEREEEMKEKEKYVEKQSLLFDTLIADWLKRP